MTSANTGPRLAVPLDVVAGAYARAAAACRRRVIVCAGTGCVANGALKVYEAFVKHLGDAGLDVVTELSTEAPGGAHDVHVSHSGCQGFCQMGPLVTLMPDAIFYTKVRPDDVPELVSASVVRGETVERLLYVDPASGALCRTTEAIPFYRQQERLTLKQCGHLDPEDIREYIALGGYAASRRAWVEMTPDAVCQIIAESGLRGRGGGGFPTGRKWELARLQPDPKKYVVCNADEGDPGAFMDRSVLEGNPHAVLEGMMIAAHAIGADEGYIYVRAEYPLAVERVRRAVADAEDFGLLGEGVLGTDRAFRVHVMEGAGAFVCGEETALIASLEGRRGMPDCRPPFPAERGLWGKPTVINNVETLATVPPIMQMGAAAFRRSGTPGSPGTKTFALTGHVVNTGLIEVPFGATLRQIVYQIGGGVTDARGRLAGQGFKAVQIGGPSGGCLTADHADLLLDFDSLRGVGAMVGSGGLVVMNQSTCLVSVARFFMRFTQNESCGKCVPCRIGTRRMLQILDRIIQGRGQPEDLQRLETLGEMIRETSLCGLGQTAPNPVLSTLRHFRDEYIAHVVDRRCPAKECRGLFRYAIEAEKCKACGLCKKNCPADAITGAKKVAHVIDQAKCTLCGTCFDKCALDAILKV